ncbi:MAG: single-stranded DNA-binding protein [Acidimicrobiales bacterium]
MADNTVTVIGNVTRDPELRFTPSGMAIATFGLAVNRMWTDRQTNERKEQVSFFDIKCWSQLGENVSTSVAKGNRVIVSGRLEQQSWEQDGQKRSKVEIVADEVGPSLRWATAAISRNERKDAGGDFGGTSTPRPVPNEPTGTASTTDEEPF